VESTSFDGEAVHLFLIKKGKVIEYMFGNYDSYGRVFSNKKEKNGLRKSFKWELPWNLVCDLMFSDNNNNGIAAILDSDYKDEIPTERSEGDPNQGWGEDGKSMGDTSSDKFKKVENPFHKIY